MRFLIVTFPGNLCENTLHLTVILYIFSNPHIVKNFVTWNCVATFFVFSIYISWQALMCAFARPIFGSVHALVVSEYYFKVCVELTLLFLTVGISAPSCHRKPVSEMYFEKDSSSQHLRLWHRSRHQILECRLNSVADLCLE